MRTYAYCALAMMALLMSACQMQRPANVVAIGRSDLYPQRQHDPFDRINPSQVKQAYTTAPSRRTAAGGAHNMNDMMALVEQGHSMVVNHGRALLDGTPPAADTVGDTLTLVTRTRKKAVAWVKRMQASGYAIVVTYDKSTSCYRCTAVRPRQRGRQSRRETTP